MDRYDWTEYADGDAYMEKSTLGEWVKADEALAAIAAMEAEVARKDAAIKRALDEAVADDMDGWYADLSAAITPR